jgi:uncharacterized MAPEG superfamily protein
VELKLLAAAIAVGFVQLLWAAFAARRQQGLEWGAGSRDEPRPITGVAARLDRALKNFLETFPFFAAAVLTAGMAGKFGTLTLWGSALYVLGRALYAPIYAAGIAYVRTVFWTVATIGLVMVVAAIFI